MKGWDGVDERRAYVQGWRIGSSEHLEDTVLTIERLDDPSSVGLRYAEPRFQSDEQAEAYVRGRAEAGCTLAHKALRLTSHVFRTVGKAHDWNDLSA